MNYLDNELSIIMSSTIKRKLKTELIELIDMGIINSEEEINIDTDKNGNYTVGFYNLNDNKHYEYIVPCGYPFSPPKLNINYKPYSTYLSFNLPSYKDLILKYTKMRCFCCNTISCPSNWGPQLTIYSFIKEVGNFRNISRKISYCVIIDVIKRKYLNDDINIIEWL